MLEVRKSQRIINFKQEWNNLKSIKHTQCNVKKIGISKLKYYY